MKFSAKTKANKFAASDECTVWEYTLDSTKASSAVAKISGRYPLPGWMMNEVSDELVYVVSGTGKLLTPSKSHDLSSGDTALIEAGDKFAWEGDSLAVFIPCVPAWTPDQHKIVAGQNVKH